MLSPASFGLIFAVVGIALAFVIWNLDRRSKMTAAERKSEDQRAEEEDSIW